MGRCMDCIYYFHGKCVNDNTEKDVFYSCERFARPGQSYVSDQLAVALRKDIDEQENHPEHPEHYQGDGIECIDAIKAAMTPEEFRGFLRGNVMKYVWRYDRKGGVNDLYKASDYLCRLIDEITEGTE